MCWVFFFFRNSGSIRVGSFEDGILMKQISFEGTIERPEWHEAFMFDAIHAATRATCLKRAVGAVLVRDKRVIASGYAGAPPKTEHCLDMGHCYYERIAWQDREKGLGDFKSLKEARKHLCLAVHAEANALNQCSDLGIAAHGATLYITNFPCPGCVRDRILSNHITKIFYWKEYLQNPAVTIDELRESERLLAGARVTTKRIDLTDTRIMEIARLMTMVGERTDYSYKP